MSAAAVEQPAEQPTLLEAADMISSQLVGHRVEIIGGQISVTPPASGQHAYALTDIMVKLLAAGLHGEDSAVVQAVGIWLPEGPFDYAIPDLALVDGDFADHEVEYNCFDPGIFRFVAEGSSTNLSDDLKKKPSAYATAGVPVYLIADRKNRRVMVLSDPQDGEYRVHAVYRPGQAFELPESIGAVVSLDVDRVLGPEK